VSVIRMSNMHFWPRSQKPWQLASPLSLVVVGGVGGVPAVGVDGGGGGVVLPSATLARQLTHEKIRGLLSTRLGESAVPHRCLHSSATIRTRPPTLHDSACSTNIFALQPLQAAGISNGVWLYPRRTLSLHLSTNRLVPFNRFGKTESHASAAQFQLSRLATEGLSRPQQSRKSRSASSQAFLAACPALVAQWRCAPRSNRDPAPTRDTVRWRIAASEAKWTLRAVSTRLRMASPPCLTPWVRSWPYSPPILVNGIPRRTGRKLVRISDSSLTRGDS
jgi:hypothetical protein